MASISGSGGSVNDGSAIADVTTWSAEVTGNVTAYGSSDGAGWKQRKLGTKDITGTISVKLATGAAKPYTMGQEIAVLTLTADGSTSLSGPAVIESVSYNVDIDNGEPVGAEISFGANGAWSGL